MPSRLSRTFLIASLACTATAVIVLFLVPALGAAWSIAGGILLLAAVACAGVAVWFDRD